MDMIRELFEKHNDEFLKSDYYPHLQLKKRQWYVLERLNEVTPGHCLINSSRHDEITFDTDPEDFLTHFNEEEIIDLIRCGLVWQDDYDCFAMYI